MKNVPFFLLAAGLFWTGCFGNSSLGSAATAQVNVENLQRISVGMTETQVQRIMRRPYSHEKVEVGGEDYEFWFYITKPTLMDQTRITRTGLTPLTFRNKILIGIGYEPYNRILKKEEATRLLEKKGKPEVEDHSLEKALQAPSSSKSSAPPKKGGPNNTSPSQPKPMQPAPPTNPQSGAQPPNVENKKGKDPKGAPSKSVTMAKRPEPQQPQDDKESKDKKPKPQQPIREKDEQMLNEEQDLNFDYW